MRKTVSIFFIVVLLLCNSTASCADGEEWKQAYSAVLEEITSFWEPRKDDLAVEYSYFIYDVDKDGIPELVIKTGTCEADYMAVIYSCREGRAVKIEEVGAGHSSFYGDLNHEGLIIYQGHMGYAYACRYTIHDSRLEAEKLFEDDLYARLENDPDAYYHPVSDFVPGAIPLTLIEAYNPLAITHYDEICAGLASSLPSSDNLFYPQNDPDFYTKLISNDSVVFAYGTDRFANSPGEISFHSLLKKDAAARWMNGDLIIRDMLAADLNGDGQLECILNLSEEDGNSPVRFFLSEEDGTLYVYIQNYSYNSLIAEKDGSFQLISEYDQLHYRLIFEKEHCFLLQLGV